MPEVQTIPDPDPKGALLCPSCHAPGAEIERLAPPVMILWCPVCRNRWTAYEPAAATN